MGLCRRRRAKRLEQTIRAAVGRRGRPGRQNLVCIVGGNWVAHLQGKSLALLRRHPGLAFLFLVSRRGSRSEGK